MTSELLSRAQHEGSYGSGTLPDSWAWATLDVVGDIITGTTPSKSGPANYGGVMPFVKPGDLDVQEPIQVTSEYLSEQGAKKARVIPSGSTMVTCIGATIGKTGISGTEVATNQQINSLVPYEGLQSRFAYYYCLSPFFQGQVKANASSTTLPILNKSRFGRLPIPIAPFSEQSRIVTRIEELFTQLDAGVAGLKHIRANLQRYKAAVLKAACEGKLVPQDASDEPAPRLLERILAERRARWEEELRAKGKDPAKTKYKEPAPPSTQGLPELPEGWAWARFEHLLTELKNGYFSGTPAPEPPGVPILRINAVRPLSVNLASPRYLPANEMDKASQYVLRNGDLLFTRYNGSLELVGACGMVRNLDTPMLYPDKLIRARIPANNLLSAYLELYFATAVPRRVIENKVKSSAGQQGIAGADLKSIPVPVAPLAEQERIVVEVERRLSVVQELEDIIEANQERAERLRQAILRQAFEGKLVPQEVTDEPASLLLERVQRSQNSQDNINTDRDQSLKIVQGEFEFDRAH